MDLHRNGRYCLDYYLYGGIHHEHLEEKVIYRTHCALRLGDNLCHLHFMRKLALRYPAEHFVHFAHRCYLPQLVDLVSDLENLKLRDLESVNDGTGDFWSMRPHPELHSRDAWKNTGRYWETHPQKNDWVNFSLRHFANFTWAMGLPTLIEKPGDLLFDYPALRNNEARTSRFDMLIVNSSPLSNQVPAFKPSEMETLVGELSQRHSCITTAPTRFNVPCTAAQNLTVTQIGDLSRFCRYIVMVSTGPSWVTFNVFNQESVEYRLIILDQERINLSQNTDHARTVEGSRQALMKRGLL